MSEDDFFVWVILILIFIGIPWASWNYDLNIFSDEISTYLQIKKCTGSENNNCKWINNIKTTYKVIPENQSVIFWSSSKPWPLQLGKKCVVVNKKHWSCGEYYQFGFNEGEFTGEVTENYRYVSKTTWWFYKLF